MRKTLIATAIMIALSSGSLYAQTQASSSNPSKSGSKNRAEAAAQNSPNAANRGVYSTGMTTTIKAPIDQSNMTTANQKMGWPGNLGNSQPFSDSQDAQTMPIGRAGTAAPMTSSTATSGTAATGTATVDTMQHIDRNTATGAAASNRADGSTAGATGAMMDDAATTTATAKPKSKKSKSSSSANR